MLRYIGDISEADSSVLRRHAQASQRILEFGSGASTQVLSRCCHPSARITSVDTDPKWIERTRANLVRLGLTHPVEFISYKRWKADLPAADPFDLVFDDGRDDLRLSFARQAWPLLRVGGWLLFHDTRRDRDFRNVLDLLRDAYLEVDVVQVNEASSNITALRKKVAEPWVDWNVVEGRERWEYGHAEPPAGLWEKKK
jgi:predicted O-methyltransferase YrrM